MIDITAMTAQMPSHTKCCHENIRVTSLFHSSTLSAAAHLILCKLFLDLSTEGALKQLLQSDIGNDGRNDLQCQTL